MKQDSFLANKGILSIKEVFCSAMSDNPVDLNPDKLFPIIDATTVKRIQQFIQKYYKNDILKHLMERLYKLLFLLQELKLFVIH